MIFAAFTVLNLCSCSNTTTQDNTQKSSQNETQQENNQSSQSIEDSATSSSDGWQAEEGTSDRVNEIIFKGRDDAETATDETINAAVQWFKDNEANIFEGSENMEQAKFIPTATKLQRAKHRKNIRYSLSSRLLFSFFSISIPLTWNLQRQYTI